MNKSKSVSKNQRNYTRLHQKCDGSIRYIPFGSNISINNNIYIIPRFCRKKKLRISIIALLP